MHSVACDPARAAARTQGHALKVADELHRLLDVPFLGGVPRLTVRRVGLDRKMYRTRNEAKADVFDYTVTYHAERGGTVIAYTLHFRTGIFEGVSECTVSQPPKPKTIPLTAVEQRIAEAVKGYLKYWDEKNIGPPYYLFVSVLFAQGLSGMSVPWRGGGIPLKRRHLLLPAHVVAHSDGTSSVGTLLKPTFDLLWNGFGYDGSINYDDRGHYQVRR
jgi:hypothetical protein